MNKIPAALFHYTTGHKLAAIADSRQLEPRGFGAATSAREKPVLWFSENPMWEGTANKLVSSDGGKTFFRPTMRELQQAVGLYRFRLNTRNVDALREMGIKLHSWTHMPAMAHIAPGEVQRMVTFGLKLGSTPTHWWGTFSAVPLTLMSSGVLLFEHRPIVEPGQGQETWVAASFDEAVAAFTANGPKVLHSTVSAQPATRGL